MLRYRMTSPFLSHPTIMTTLYHASIYRNDELKPGIHYTGKKIEWDETESNEWLYASKDRLEALGNALAAYLEKNHEVDRVSFDDSTFVVHSDRDITEDQVRKAKIFLYTVKTGNWTPVKNKVNGSTTEYKTKDTIVVDAPEEILDPLQGRELVILKKPLTRAQESIGSFVRFAFGEIEVTIRDRIITVSGVKTALLEDGMRRLFGTSTISSHLITPSRNSFKFHEFFIVDMLFILKGVVESKKISMASRNTCNKILIALKTHTWAGKIFEHEPIQIDRKRLADLTYTPKDFQDEFFDNYVNAIEKYRLKGFLFAGAAGSGKTFSGLAITHLREVDQLIVVCPKNAVTRVWEDNIKNVFKAPPSYWTSDMTTPFTGKEKILVIHYEYEAKFLAQYTPKPGAKIGILLDESHNLNELSAMRTQLFLEMCEIYQPSDVIWLSGTPIKALGIEAIPLLRCIDPLFDARAEETFRKIFRGDANKATAVLRNRLGLVQFSVEKSRLQLAPPIFVQRKVAFEGSERFTLKALKDQMIAFIKERNVYYESRKKEDYAFYDEILERVRLSVSRQRDGLAQFDEYRACVKVIQRTGGIGAKDQMVYANQYEARVILPMLGREEAIRFKEVKTIVKYVHMKIQGECLGRVVGRARIDCHVELAKHLDYVDVCESTTKKTVIFSSYVEVVNSAEQACLASELSPIKVYADTSWKLPQIIEAFGRDSAINPLIATYASLSTAVPLIMADTMVLIDPPFRDYILQQAVSRIHRLGSDTQTYVHMVELDTGVEPNLSTRGVDILKWSQEQIGLITGVTSPFSIGEDGQVIGMEAFEDHAPSHSLHFGLSSSLLSW